MKRLASLIVCVAISAGTVHAQLVTPQLSRPATEPAAGDVLHEKYEAAWFQYEQAIGEVRDKVNTALDAQFEKAADTGNLDLADFWDKMKKLFLDTGAVAWPSDGKTKVEWRKTYPTTDFPDDFTEVITHADAGFKKAVATLKEDYEGLVKDYTKGRNLARAKHLRDELAGLARKPAAPPDRPIMVDKKPERAAREQQKVGTNIVFPRNGVELQRFLAGTAWKNQNGFTFEWDSAGNLWHCRDGGRTPVEIAYTSANRCAVEYVNKAKQILVFNERFTQFEQLGADGRIQQTALRLR